MDVQLVQALVHQELVELLDLLNIVILDAEDLQLQQRLEAIQLLYLVAAEVQQDQLFVDFEPLDGLDPILRQDQALQGQALFKDIGGARDALLSQVEHDQLVLVEIQGELGLCILIEGSRETISYVLKLSGGVGQFQRSGELEVLARRAELEEVGDHGLQIRHVRPVQIHALDLEVQVLVCLFLWSLAGLLQDVLAQLVEYRVQCVLPLIVVLGSYELILLVL